MNHKTCDEILSQLQLSLQRCKNNKEIYNYIGPELIDITTCANITSYKTRLISTKTTLDIKVPIIKPCVSYYVEYNVTNRCITMDKIL
jgi:hypothetical protein